MPWGVAVVVLTTKIHMLSDRHGWLLAFTLSAGQEANGRDFMSTLEKVRLPGSKGRSRKHCRHIMTEKDYGSEVLRCYCDRHRMALIFSTAPDASKAAFWTAQRLDKPRY